MAKRKASPRTFVGGGGEMKSRLLNLPKRENASLWIKNNAYMKAYNQRPEVKAYMKAYNKAYNQRPEVKAYKKAYKKAYNQRPEVKAYNKAYMKAYNQKKVLALLSEDGK